MSALVQSVSDFAAAIKNKIAAASSGGGGGGGGTGSLPDRSLVWFGTTAPPDSKYGIWVWNGTGPGGQEYELRVWDASVNSFVEIGVRHWWYNQSSGKLYKTGDILNGKPMYAYAFPRFNIVNTGWVILPVPDSVKSIISKTDPVLIDWSRFYIGHALTPGVNQGGGWFQYNDRLTLGQSNMSGAYVNRSDYANVPAGNVMQVELNITNVPMPNLVCDVTIKFVLT